MEIVTKQAGEALVVSLEGSRLDAAQSVRFKEAMRALVENHAGRIVLDMSRVEFMDSSGLGALVAVLKLEGARGELVLTGLTPAVAKVFALTRMDRVFKIVPGAEDALAGGARAAG